MNERRKNEYIEIARLQNEALVLHLKTYFNNVKPFEKEYGKDICDFVATEIITLYKSFGTSSINYLTVMNSQYSKYTDWCLNEHLVKDNQNHFREIDQDTLASCLNKIRMKAMVVSEEDCTVILMRFKMFLINSYVWLYLKVYAERMPAKYLICV